MVGGSVPRSPLLYLALHGEPEDPDRVLEGAADLGVGLVDLSAGLRRG